MVEEAVGISKSIMKKAREDRRDYLVGLMEYRNTPISDLDLSPAQMMFNRRLKTKLPISNKLLNAELFNNIREKLIKRQNVQKIHYDKTAHPLPELEPEDNFANKTTSRRVGCSSKPFGYCIRKGRHDTVLTVVEEAIITTSSSSAYSINSPGSGRAVARELNTA
ncbi:transposon Tf2-6 polyprotein [Trichonephila clavipes]|nr:transposon Tf2-6 polyprotein [Trichonephila clavipes]